MMSQEWHPLLKIASFLVVLVAIDLEFLSKTRKAKCPHCGGALHAGFYERKLAIETSENVEQLNVSFSLCCSNDGCRKRTQPPSVRFCGRSSFPLAAIALAEVFCKGPSQKRVAEVCKLLGAHERTVRRWLNSWKGITATAFWKERLGRGLPESEDSALMRLVLLFTTAHDDAVLSLSAFLHDLSNLKFNFSRTLAPE